MVRVKDNPPRIDSVSVANWITMQSSYFGKCLDSQVSVHLLLQQVFCQPVVRTLALAASVLSARCPDTRDLSKKSFICCTTNPHFVYRNSHSVPRGWQIAAHPWSPVPVVLWFPGPLVLWSSFSLVLWSSGDQRASFFPFPHYTISSSPIISISTSIHRQSSPAFGPPCWQSGCGTNADTRCQRILFVCLSSPRIGSAGKPHSMQKQHFAVRPKSRFLSDICSM